MKRMRLVPESDFSTPVAHIKPPVKGKRSKKPKDDLSKILLAKNVPHDVRNLFYQDQLRRQNRKKKIKAQRPILVKDISRQVTTPPPPPLFKSPIKVKSPNYRSTSPEAGISDHFLVVSAPYVVKNIVGNLGPSLLQLVLDSGTTYNDRFEAVVDGIRFPNSNIINILNHIAHKNDRNEYIAPFGYDEVVGQIQEHNEIPTSLRPYFNVRERVRGADSSYTTPTNSPTATSTPQPRSVRVTVRRGSKGGNVRKRISETWKELGHVIQTNSDEEDEDE